MYYPPYLYTIETIGLTLILICAVFLVGIIVLRVDDDTPITFDEVISRTKEFVIRKLQEKQKYLINQNLYPYEDEILKLNILKFFKLFRCEHEPNIVTVVFQMIGVRKEYLESPEILKNLLSAKLEQFYFERLGPNMPTIYVSFVQEGEARILISKDAYGSLLIQRRAESDRLSNKPFCGDLTESMITCSPNKICVGVDLSLFEDHQGLTIPIEVDFLTNLHWLICGNSGSGKSYFVIYFLINLLRIYGIKLKITICDFKAEDFIFLKNSGYSRYYSGENCAQGLENFYLEYMQVKNGEINDSIVRLLIFDEWAGFYISESLKNKKQADQYLGYQAEMLNLGRSLGVGIVTILQRIDAKHTPGREQYFCTVALGKLSSDFKKMIMQDDSFEQRVTYSPGEGIIKQDTVGTRYLKVPKIENLDDIKKEIVNNLMETDSLPE